ncbi:MAG: MauE/DoxX family redox-associated membrane protein [bacterium]
MRTRLARAWPAAALGCRVIVGGFFVAAALGKLSRPAALFANQIKAFAVAPEGWETPLAHALPWVELVSGGMLLAGMFSMWAAGLVAAQLAAFSFALAAAMAAGTAPPDCGCLPGVSETPAQALARDAIMFLWTAVVIRRLPGPFSLDGWLGRGAEGGRGREA